MTTKARLARAITPRSGYEQHKMAGFLLELGAKSLRR